MHVEVELNNETEWHQFTASRNIGFAESMCLNKSLPNLRAPFLPTPPKASLCSGRALLLLASQAIQPFSLTDDPARSIYLWGPAFSLCPQRGCRPGCRSPRPPVCRQGRPAARWHDNTIVGLLARHHRWAAVRPDLHEILHQYLPLFLPSR